VNGPLPPGAERAGRYEIRRALGGGGMGDVFHVFDPVRRRDLALKVLKFTYPRALHYFKREFRSIARLRHTNLVSLYDLHVEDGHYFFTMELVDGVDLYLHVNESNAIIEEPRQLTAPARQGRIRRAFVQMLRGLAYLHASGCVHRDLKPSNVMVDRDGVCKILDFGIVKELLPGTEGQSLSQVFGTATYMSPEQSQGARVGPASDMYAAGVVLYELIAGTPPFDGESQIVAHAHQTARPPSLVQKVPGVQPELALVCMALLEKDPNDRPSAREALEMLGERVEADLDDSAEFVGRRQARKALHEALEQVRTGTGRMVVLEGQSGSGKTALANAFCAEARIYDAVQITGICVHRDHVPARGLDTIVERIAEAWRRRTAEIIRALPPVERAALITTFPFLGELLPKTMHGPVGERPPGGPRAGTALTTLLSELGKKRLLVLLLEHLHLADDVTLELLTALQGQGRLPGVLFLLSVRPEAVVPGSPLAHFLELVETHPHISRMALLPLLPDETRRLAAMHVPDLHPADAERLHDESGGDPLFVTELLREMVRHPGQGVPSLDTLVRQTLSTLTTEAQHVLRVVSVSRFALPGAVLQAACELPADVMYEALDRLDAEDLVRSVANAAGEVSVSPVHARLMDLVRRNTPAPERTTMHVMLARAYEAHGGPAAAIAHHWSEAGEAKRAPVFALEAAEEAQRAGQHARAADLLSLVVRTPPPGVDPLRLWADYADELARAGRYAEAVNAMDRLIVDLKPVPAEPWQVRRAELRLIAGHFGAFVRDDPALPAGPVRVRIAELLLPYDPGRVESMIGAVETPDALLVRAVAGLDGDAPARALTRASKLYKEATAGTHDPLLAVRTRVELLRAEGQTHDARTVLDEALGRLPPMSPEPAHVGLRIARVEVALDLGELPVARTRIRSLHGDTRLKGQLTHWVRICQLMARTHLDSGEWQAAERRLNEAEQIWPVDPVTLPTLQTALLRVRHFFLSTDAHTAAAALRRLEAHAPYQRLLALREPAGEVSLLAARIAAVRAATAFRHPERSGLSSARETLLDRMRALRNAVPAPLAWLNALAGLADVLAGENDACIERLEKFVIRPGDPIVRALAAHILSQVRTDDALADQDLRHAEVLLRDCGGVPAPEAVALGAAAR
jgi:tetratricopeptide (TPR) repeat protein